MASKEYQLIGEESVPDDDSPFATSKRGQISNSSSFLTKILLVALVLSLSVNVLWAIKRIKTPCSDTYSKESKYAGLQRDLPIAWNHDSDFASHNRTIWDNAWETLDQDIGVVALSNDFVANKSLHPAQRWPWDSSKGLYLLHGYHNLHCLTIIRTALVEMHDNVPQSLHFSHVNHCLDAFRQDIICNADDTPRYTGLRKSTSMENPSSGIGQVRMCRDWGKLERWAREHSACYKYQRGATTPEGIPADLFKHCPDGKKPWEA